MGIDAEMFIKRKGPKPSDEQLKTWSWDLCAAIGADFFYLREKDGQAALELTGKYLQKYEPETVLGKVYTQDGPDIVAADDEWFIEVNLSTRYYGIGYERGNWQVIVNVARWLELNIGVKDRRMIRYRWGANFIAVACQGCGKDVCSRDGGETWEKAEPL